MAADRTAALRAYFDAVARFFRTEGAPPAAERLDQALAALHPDDLERVWQLARLELERARQQAGVVGGPDDGR